MIDMLRSKYLIYLLLLCNYGAHLSRLNDKAGNVTNARQKRDISEPYGKTFEKRQISLSSFTKDGSTLLFTKTWPRLVIYKTIIYVMFLLEWTPCLERR